MKSAKVMCDRCAFGSEKPATERRQFSVEDTIYRLELCDKHAEMLDREFHVWVQLAEEIGTAPPQRSQFFIDERKAEAVKIRELAERARRENSVQRFAAERAAQLSAEYDERLARQSIPGAMDWRLTTHAAERMQERGYTVAEVLGAAAFPDTRFRQPWRGPDIVIHQRAGCRVVVDDRTRAIITVIDRNDRLETEPPRQERTAL